MASSRLVVPCGVFEALRPCDLPLVCERTRAQQVGGRDRDVSLDHRLDLGVCDGHPLEHLEARGRQPAVGAVLRAANPFDLVEHQADEFVDEELHGKAAQAQVATVNVTGEQPE